MEKKNLAELKKEYSQKKEALKEVQECAKLERDILLIDQMIREVNIDREYTSIGGRLKKARSEKGLTLVELAKKMDVTPQYISQYERGVRIPKKETLDKFLVALEITEEELFLNDKDKELLSYFNLLNDEGQQKGIDYMSNLSTDPNYRKDPEQ